MQVGGGGGGSARSRRWGGGAVVGRGSPRGCGCGRGRSPPPAASTQALRLGAVTQAPRAVPAAQVDPSLGSFPPPLISTYL